MNWMRLLKTLEIMVVGAGAIYGAIWAFCAWVALMARTLPVCRTDLTPYACGFVLGTFLPAIALALIAGAGCMIYDKLGERE